MQVFYESHLVINTAIYMLVSSELLIQTNNISKFYFKLQLILSLSGKNLTVLAMSFKITECISYKGLIKTNTQTTITIILGIFFNRFSPVSGFQHNTRRVIIILTQNVCLRIWDWLNAWNKKVSSLWNHLPLCPPAMTGAPALCRDLLFTVCSWRYII